MSKVRLSLNLEMPKRLYDLWVDNQEELEFNVLDNWVGVNFTFFPEYAFLQISTDAESNDADLLKHVHDEFFKYLNKLDLQVNYDPSLGIPFKPYIPVIYLR